MAERRKITGDYQYRALRSGFVIQRFWHKNRISLFKHFAEVKRTDIVLDAGCGSGNLVFEVAPTCQRAIGLDRNHDAIKFARETAKKLNLSNVEFIECNLEKIPLAGNSADKIILFDVLEHCSQAGSRKVMVELRRILKSGGEIFITTPNYGSFWPFLEWVLDTFNLAAVLRGEQHISRFRSGDLSRLSGDYGFVIGKMGSISHLSPFLAILSWSLANRVFKWEVKRGGLWGPILYCIITKK